MAVKPLEADLNKMVNILKQNFDENLAEVLAILTGIRRIFKEEIAVSEIFLTGFIDFCEHFSDIKYQISGHLKQGRVKFYFINITKNPKIDFLPVNRLQKPERGLQKNVFTFNHFVTHTQQKIVFVKFYSVVGRQV